MRSVLLSVSFEDGVVFSTDDFSVLDLSEISLVRGDCLETSVGNSDEVFIDFVGGLRENTPVSLMSEQSIPSST